MFVQPLTYAYNSEISDSTGTALFRLVLSRHQPVPTTLHCPSALPTDAEESNASSKLKPRRFHRIAVMQ